LLVIAAIISTLFTIFTTIGITGDHLSRMYRNYDVLTITSFVIIIFGVGLTLTAPFAKRKKRRTTAGIWIFLVGVGSALGTGIAAVGTENRPELTALIKLKDGVPTIVASVRYEGLKSTDKVTLQIVGGVPRANKALERRRLLSIELGPDPRGNLEREFEVPISPSTLSRFYVITGPDSNDLLDATSKGNKTPRGLCTSLAEEDVLTSDLASCVEVAVPDYTRIPDVEARWADHEHLEVSVRDTHLRMTEPLALRVMGKGPGEIVASPLFDALLPRTDGTSGEGRKLYIEVPAGYGEVCVEAVRGMSRSNVRPDCMGRPAEDDNAAWLLMARPAAGVPLPIGK
jgi:hypothetical protein